MLYSMNILDAAKITAPLGHETKPVSEMTEAEQDDYWRARRDEEAFWENNYSTRATEDEDETDPDL